MWTDESNTTYFLLRPIEPSIIGLDSDFIESVDRERKGIKGLDGQMTPNYIFNTNLDTDKINRLSDSIKINEEISRTPTFCYISYDYDIVMLLKVKLRKPGLLTVLYEKNGDCYELTNTVMNRKHDINGTDPITYYNLKEKIGL